MSTSTDRPADKIAIILAENLLPWRELNVTAFLTSGITAYRPDLVGAPYRDGDQVDYLPMLGLPVLVMTAGAADLSRMRERAASRGLPTALFTRVLFKTGNDEDNRAAVAAVHGDSLDLVGLGFVGPRNAVDKITKGARLHT